MDTSVQMKKLFLNTGVQKKKFYEWTLAFKWKIICEHRRSREGNLWMNTSVQMKKIFANTDVQKKKIYERPLAFKCSKNFLWTLPFKGRKLFLNASVHSQNWKTWDFLRYQIMWIIFHIIRNLSNTLNSYHIPNSIWKSSN